MRIYVDLYTYASRKAQNSPKAQHQMVFGPKTLNHKSSEPLGYISNQNLSLSGFRRSPPSKPSVSRRSLSRSGATKMATPHMGCFCKLGALLLTFLSFWVCIRAPLFFGKLPVLLPPTQSKGFPTGPRYGPRLESGGMCFMGLYLVCGI